MTVRVLFVCLGNICRSPMAEAVFAHLVERAGLDGEIEIDSAGTSSYHIGQRAHRGTRDVLRRNGIDYEGDARQVTPRDFERFDYILAMDGDNLADLRRLMPKDSQAVVKRFLDYADGVKIHDVPDPYYTNRFDDVYALVRQGAEGLLAAIRQDKGL